MEMQAFHSSAVSWETRNISRYPIIFLIAFISQLFEVPLPMDFTLVQYHSFNKKEWLKKQKIADLSFCFEFQVVVAVVGF